MSPRDERDLVASIRAPREEHERIVLETIAPLAREIEQASPEAALFFNRFNKPDWRVRVSALRLPADTEHVLRERLSEAEFGPYEPDLERYGGEEGTRIAERVFHHDTRACLAWLAAEAAGRTGRSRREYSLLVTERTLDLLGFSRAERIAFYRYGYSFEVDLDRWQTDELAMLERHHRSIRDELAATLSLDGAALWGGEEPRAIAETLLGETAPLLRRLMEGQARGTVHRGRIDLAWALTHLHANRLQIEADAEAILRYLMHRLHEEEDLCVR